MKESTVLSRGPQKSAICFEISLYGLIVLETIFMISAAVSNDYTVILAAGGSIFLLGVYAFHMIGRKKQFAVAFPGQMAGLLIFSGILTRLALAAGILGYLSDIDCFVGWSQIAYAGGLDHFYTSGIFADYPPLYMYVLYFLGMLQSVFSISATVFLIKLPAIVCDIILALLFFKAAKSRLDTTQAIFVFICMIMNAAMVVNSAAWGQIDIIFVLLAVICVYLLMKEKYAPAIIVFVLAVLLKVQAVLLAPVLMFVLARGLFKKDSRKKTVVGLLIGVAAGAAIGLLLILPFTGGRPLTWIAELYMKSMGGYSYVTVNGFNLYGLLGLNWAPLATTFLGLPFNFWGYLGIGAVCVYAAWLYRLDPRGANLFNISAFITMGVYMFGHSMHERYSFAAPILLLTAFIFMKDKRIFYASLITSGTVLINQCIALAYYGKMIPYGIMAGASVFNLIAFIYMAVVITKSAAGYHKNKDIRLVANEKQ